jgi:hypothetical protein
LAGLCPYNNYWVLLAPRPEERLIKSTQIQNIVKEEELILAIAKLEIKVSIQGDLINTLMQNANMLFLDVELPSIEQDAVKKIKAKYPMIADQLK